MPVPLLIDTDIGSDVDDALAVAYALRHPDLDVRAVTTVSGDAVRRGVIARKLLQVAGRDDVEVAAGIGGDPREGGRGAEMGHEGEVILEPGEQLALSERDGVRLMLEETARHRAAGQPLTVATIGMQTNVAAALDRDPALVDRVARLAVMGGVFAPVRIEGATLGPEVDHNLNVDQQSAVRSLNADFDTLFVPCDVTMSTWLRRSHLDRLRGSDRLCRLLADMVVAWTASLARLARGRMPADGVALLHDPLTLACLVEPGFVSMTRHPVTVAVHGGHVRTFVDPVGGRPATVVTGCDAAGFADHLVDVLTEG